jgi:DNA end-binding protein Ku
MAPRANWKGYLKLSLVSCGVALYPAVSARERVRFHIINRDTGHRIHNQRVDAETGDVVPEEDQVRGYETSRNHYVLVEDEELEQVALESTHTIDIEEFVPRSEVDEIYFDNTYYIVPDDKIGVEAFAVIREAMKKEDMVGLARVVLYRRERLLMLSPRDDGIVGTVLHYNNEVRDADSYFDDIPDVKVTSDMRDLAVHIVKSKAGHFDPEKFNDRYEKAVTALIKAKRAGKEPPEQPPPKPRNVIDLMDALRRSVRGERAGGRRRTSGRRPHARRTGRRAAGTGRSRRLKKAG